MNNLNNKINNYFQLQKEIYKAFNYQEDWRVIPLDDCRKYYWNLVQYENGTGHINFQEEKPDSLDIKWMFQSNIYTQRFLPKWVYETEHFTLICTDPQCDGNKFLSILDNSKRIK